MLLRASSLRLGFAAVAALTLIFAFDAAAQKKDKEKGGDEKAAAAPAASAPAATASASSGAYKIGVADFARVMREYNKRVQKYDALQNDMKTRQAALDTEGQSITNRATEHNKKLEDASYRGSAEADATELKIRQDEAAWRTKVSQEQLRLDQEEQKIIEECMKDIEAVVNQIASAEGYHLILDGRDGMVRGGVLYRAQSIDVTSSIIAKLNAAKG